MSIDWGFAGQVGGVGFGMVFALLIILAIVIWLTGLLDNKISADKNKIDNTKKGA
ncbi:OadG family protein [Chloroflexota bacterium]